MSIGGRSFSIMAYVEFSSPVAEAFCEICKDILGRDALVGLSRSVERNHLQEDYTGSLPTRRSKNDCKTWRTDKDQFFGCHDHPFSVQPSTRDFPRCRAFSDLWDLDCYLFPQNECT